MASRQEQARLQQMSRGEASRLDQLRAQEDARLQSMTAQEQSRINQLQAQDRSRLQQLQAGEMSRLQTLEAQEASKLSQLTAQEQARLDQLIATGDFQVEMLDRKGQQYVEQMGFNRLQAMYGLSASNLSASTQFANQASANANAAFGNFLTSAVSSGVFGGASPDTYASGAPTYLDPIQATSVPTNTSIPQTLQPVTLNLPS